LAAQAGVIARLAAAFPDGDAMPSVVQLKRTTVQFKRPPKAVIRAAIAGLSSPPADHNISGLPTL
jgi:hypothetical protein